MRGAIADFGFYDCFLCGTKQQNLSEFNSHLTTATHINCLLSRNLVSSEQAIILSEAKILSPLAKNSTDVEATTSSGVSNVRPLMESLDHNIALAFEEKLSRGGDEDYSVVESTVNKRRSRNKKKRKRIFLPMESKISENDLSISQKENVVKNLCSLSSVRCFVCDKDVGDFNSTLFHEKGRKHLQKMDDVICDIPLDANLYKCNDCGETFYSFELLWRHNDENSVEKTTSDFKLFSCVNCAESFASFRDVSHHCKAKHKDKINWNSRNRSINRRNSDSKKSLDCTIPLHCNVCNMIVPSSLTLNMHLDDKWHQRALAKEQRDKLHNK